MLKWRIGEVTVTRILELEATGGSRFILPQATREVIQEIPWLIPHFADPDGRLKMSIHALVVEAPGRRIIVDTCIGNDKQRDIPAWSGLQTSFLTDLAAAGFATDSIDTVLCTHLHVDHVGWNTMLVDGRWVPTFPKARYLIGRAEYDYWREEEAANAAPERSPFHDSVKPVWEAGLVDLVETDHQVCEEALITGDFLHHPCQFARPDWASNADFDPAASTETRQRMFGALADGPPVLVIGTHFAAPTAGHVVRDGDAFRLAV